VIVRKESDLSSSGKPSLWKFYEKGKLVRKERDTNGDGASTTGSTGKAIRSTASAKISTATATSTMDEEPNSES